MGCLKYLLRKEVIQLCRNKFLPRLIFALPVVVMLVVPLVANMEVRGIRVALSDEDRSELSSRMRAALEASPYFKGGSAEDGGFDVAVSIPRGFENSVYDGSPMKIGIDANAVNATRGGLGSGYVMSALGVSLRNFLKEKGLAAGTAGDVSVRYFYNPTQDYRYYMIPAFIIILVMLVCCFIPALNLVLEKEKGTIEQINVTPVSPLEFTLSKLIPYWVTGLVVLSEGILTAGLVYGLWPAGNVGAIYLAAVLFALAMSGFAISVANGSDTMQQSIFVLFFFVMIFMLMSGLLTPLSSMPPWAQKLTLLFPTRHFVAAMRSLYLKGTSVSELGGVYLALSALAAAFCLLAALTYRKRQG